MIFWMIKLVIAITLIPFVTYVLVLALFMACVLFVTFIRHACDWLSNLRK
jgi:hypothetical protein